MKNKNRAKHWDQIFFFLLKLKRLLICTKNWPIRHWWILQTLQFLWSYWPVRNTHQTNWSKSTRLSVWSNEEYILTMKQSVSNICVFGEERYRENVKFIAQCTYLDCTISCFSTEALTRLPSTITRKISSEHTETRDLREIAIVALSRARSSLSLSLCELNEGKRKNTKLKMESGRELRRSLVFIAKTERFWRAKVKNGNIIKKE